MVDKVVAYDEDLQLPPEVREVVAENLLDLGSPEGQAVTARFTNLFTSLNKETLPSLVQMPNPESVVGAVDVGPIINAAIANLPKGSIVGIPAGTYLLRTTITAPQGVIFWAYGCTFVVDAAVPAFRMSGAFDTIYNVSSIVETRENTPEANGKVWAQTITIPSVIAEDWRRGDTVKLIADDWIGGSRPGSGVAVAAGAVAFQGVANLFSTDTPHTLNVGDGVYINTPTPSGATSGVFDKQRYYVKSVPSSTLFTLSETYNGPELDVLLDGTAASLLKVTAESRVGQFFDVMTVTKNVGANTTTVVLIGRLLDPFTTNIRVARIRKDIPNQVLGATISLSANRIAADVDNSQGTSNLISVVNAYMPVIRDVKFLQNISATINFNGCYGYLVDNISVGWNKDNSSSRFGYGVMDNSSAYGNIRNSRFNAVRHAYSDDTVRIAANNPNMQSYGRTVGTVVDDSIAVGTSSTSWDTHHCSEGVKFSNLQAWYSATHAVAFRGRNHRAKGIEAYHCRTGVHVFNETGGGDSYGHVIEDVDIHGALVQAISATINTGTVGDNPGRFWNTISDKNNVKYKNIRVTGIASATPGAPAAFQFFNFENADVEVTDFFGEYPVAVDDATTPTRIVTSKLRGRDHDWDLSKNASGSFRLYNTEGAVAVDLDGIREFSPAGGLGTRMIRVLETNNAAARIHIDNVILDEATSSGVMPSTITSDSYLNFSIRRSASDAGYTSASNTDVNAVDAPWKIRLGRTTKDFTVVVANAADAAVGILPAGKRYGQRLTIVNTGTNPLTVNNGAGFLTSLSGTTSDKIIGNRQAMVLVWTHNNVWAESRPAPSMDTIRTTNAGFAIIIGLNVFTSGVARTWTLPAVAANNGRTVKLKNAGTGTLTVVPAAGEFVYTTATISTFDLTPGQSAELISDGTHWQRMY